ncbi:hypothetical protein B0H12DRAFT_221859 [Mycena haematopus]|nr:hypothetical protein B0H12DRAFT_221859 [Mycena haematopus]
MSTISADWKAITPGGAKEAVRQSIARISSSDSPANTNSVYQNGAAWTSGERVEGVDGGYGARSVSPTGRVHTINYPASMLNTSAAYDTGADASYFSPVTPTPHNMSFSPSSVYADDASPDSAYAPNTFGAFPASPDMSSLSSSGIPSGATSPRQTAGPLTLTSEDIRRRMTLNNSSAAEGGWRQSVDEVFVMRTGTGTDATADADADGEYLFAPQSETVFQYPGTPAPGSAFSSPGSAYTAPAYTAPAAPATASSPFAMPMQPPTMSPDAMLRAYATKHASTTPSLTTPSSLARASSPSLARAGTPSTFARTALPSLSRKPSTAPAPASRAEVVASIKDTGMRVLYKQ